MRIDAQNFVTVWSSSVTSLKCLMFVRRLRRSRERDLDQIDGLDLDWSSRYSKVQKEIALRSAINKDNLYSGMYAILGLTNANKLSVVYGEIAHCEVSKRGAKINRNLHDNQHLQARYRLVESCCREISRHRLHSRYHLLLQSQAAEFRYTNMHYH